MCSATGEVFKNMSLEYKDYYSVLGVSRDADGDEIKKAFRKLARLYHPDVAADKATAEAKFKEINEAYEVLGDPAKRRRYDTLGAEWQSGGPQRSGGRRAARGGSAGGPEFHFSGTGFSDFFEQFFGGGSQYEYSGAGPGGFAGATSYGPGRRRGNDIEGDILVTLHEAMEGTVRPITLQTMDPHSGETREHTFKVRIPPGATDGRRIRVPGRGEPGIGGGEAGDLFLRVRHAAHPDFTTDGHDIIHEHEIKPWDAVLGGEIRVPTLDGSIKMRVPPGSQNGRKLRIRGRGLPVGRKGDRGDFYVILTIDIPTGVSDAQRQLWEQLRKSSAVPV